MGMLFKLPYLEKIKDLDEYYYIEPSSLWGLFNNEDVNYSITDKLSQRLAMYLNHYFNTHSIPEYLDLTTFVKKFLPDIQFKVEYSTISSSHILTIVIPDTDLKYPLSIRIHKDPMFLYRAYSNILECNLPDISMLTDYVQKATGWKRGLDGVDRLVNNLKNVAEMNITSDVRHFIYGILIAGLSIPRGKEMVVCADGSLDKQKGKHSSYLIFDKEGTLYSSKGCLSKSGGVNSWFSLLETSPINCGALIATRERFNENQMKMCLDILDRYIPKSYSFFDYLWDVYFKTPVVLNKIK